MARRMAQNGAPTHEIERQGRWKQGGGMVGRYNLAVIRHLVLNLLKQEHSAKVGIKAKRKGAGWDFDYLIKVLCH